jgi:hypothetical protein
MAKVTKDTPAKAPKNTNLGSFVDQVTPEPKMVLENYIQLDVLSKFMLSAKDTDKSLVNNMIEIALSINKQEEFLSLGERIAINSLRKMNILV